MISVIVPVYNTEKYLRKCIDSILSQTYSDIELILVNDGSTDNSGKICDEYAKIDERVRVIHKENGGQATARNMAMRIASGEYFAFVDSDDYIAPDMYEGLLSAIEENGCDIAICARYNVDENTGEERAVFALDKPCIIDNVEALERLCIYDSVDSAPCDKLIKRKLFDGIEFPKGYICEDVDVTFRVLDRAKKIVHTGKPYYYYLQRRGSTSRSRFSEKTLGLEIYHRNVSEYVKEKYPNLSEKADFFYLSRLITLYNIMIDSGYRGEHKKRIRKLISENYSLIKKNSYFTKRTKTKALLIRLGIYEFVKPKRKI